MQRVPARILVEAKSFLCCVYTNTTDKQTWLSIQIIFEIYSSKMNPPLHGDTSAVWWATAETTPKHTNTKTSAVKIMSVYKWDIVRVKLSFDINREHVLNNNKYSWLGLVTSG